MTVVVTGDDLTLDEVVRVARDHEPAELSPDALARMEAARTVVEHVLERNVPVYGMTTGVGVRSEEHTSELQSP